MNRKWRRTNTPKNFDKEAGTQEKCVSFSHLNFARRLNSLAANPQQLYLLSQKSLFPRLKTRSAPALARCYPRSFTFYLGNPFPRLKTRSAPALARCYPSQLYPYLGNPFSSIENSLGPRSRSLLPSQLYLLSREIPFPRLKTRSAPALARCYPRSFTFYLGNPFPRFLIS